jgi:hypothetical protein
MPSTAGVAKSGSELEPHGTADKKSGSVLEPPTKKNKKFFSQPYIFRLPVIYPVKGFPSKSIIHSKIPAKKGDETNGKNQTN